MLELFYQLRYVFPKYGFDKDILSIILSYFNDEEISLKHLDAVGCDDTTSNTGWKTRTNRQIR